MCPECAKYRQRWIDALLQNLDNGIDFYAEMKEKYGEDNPEVQELERPLREILKLLDRQASSS